MKRRPPCSPVSAPPASPKLAEDARSCIKARANAEQLAFELSRHADSPKPGTLARLQRLLDPDAKPALVSSLEAKARGNKTGRKPSRKPDRYSLFHLGSHPDMPALYSPIRRKGLG